MKRLGASIIFVNDNREILLFLRDNDPSIPFPNMWDVLGGHVEDKETPEACIVREMKEELGVTLKGFNLFSVTEYSDRIEYTFWKKTRLDIDKVTLMEGQRLKWFTRQEAALTRLAGGFNQIVHNFFEKKPFQ
jgi:8-oxo-dGTP diphosphatase